MSLSKIKLPPIKMANERIIKKVETAIVNIAPLFMMLVSRLYLVSYPVDDRFRVELLRNLGEFVYSLKFQPY
jgi:hypothetical protein